MKINFEKEFAQWVKKQPHDYVANTSTEEILVKYITGAFLGEHYMEMCNILVEDAKQRATYLKTAKP